MVGNYVMSEIIMGKNNERKVVRVAVSAYMKVSEQFRFGASTSNQIRD